VLSGAYPAFVLSAYRPVTVLKGQLKNSAKGLWLRRSLITLQFVASVVLLVGTFAVYRQLQFMRKGNLGVNIHQTLVVKAPQVEGNGSTLGKMQVFKTEVQGIGRIESVTSSTEVPGKEVGQARDNIYRVGESPSSATTYNIYGIDDQFIPTYGISLAAGRNFSRAYRTDSGAVVLNEEAARQLGFASPAASVGQKISHPERGPLEVIGVVRNFHQRGFREAHNPTLFLLQRGSTGFISLRIGANGLAAEAMDGTIGKIKKEYEQAFPGNPFDYFFLDDYYNQQYKADQQFGTVFSFFAALAIIIACLGLSGLISLTTLQRTKEIGVRKVLGASLSEILLLLSRDFLRLVLWANLIAWPIAWYLTGKWLENYVFRITVSPWLFVLPALLVGVVALLTVCVQTLKAARANPVDSLKYE
jgi:putative ABC transport system permease protein